MFPQLNLLIWMLVLGGLAPVSGGAHLYAYSYWSKVEQMTYLAISWIRTHCCLPKGFVVGSLSSLRLYRGAN